MVERNFLGSRPRRRTPAQVPLAAIGERTGAHSRPFLRRPRPPRQRVDAPPLLRRGLARQSLLFPEVRYSPPRTDASSSLSFYATRPSTCEPRSRNGVLSAYLVRSEEHTSELQSQFHLVCRLLLEKKE